MSSKYGISNRTLRYYEELGLLTSIREPNSSKRLYDQETLRRLELILLLKQLDFSVKDITAVILTADVPTIIEVFGKKLEDVKENISKLLVLKSLLNRYLELLQLKDYTREGTVAFLTDSLRELSLDTTHVMRVEGKNNYTEMEEIKSMDIVTKLEDHQVRFIELKPTRIAYYHSAGGNQPEDDAWDVLYAWVKEKGLDQAPATRYFGHNQPGENNEHGYEMFATVADDVEPSGEIRIKQMDGGLYAVSSLYGLDIPDAWNRLNEWVQSSKYRTGAHHWLEEHFLFNGDMFVNEAFQLDLYMPIVKKD